MDAEEAVQVFSGVMLGDGGLALRRFCDNANFRMALSSKKQGIPSVSLIGYLHFVMGALASLGVEAMTGHPKVFKRVRPDGQTYDYCDLETKVSPFLTHEYLRWYSNGRKEVPKDLVLTPISVAHWFMGDGTSSKQAAGKPLFDCVNLCTQAFNSYSQELLKVQLLGLSIYATIQRSGSKQKIYILQDSVDDFMRVVDPHVIEPYRYKIKYRRC